MWFDGQIANGIAKAKKENNLLIVYIHGEDDNSKRVSDYWESDDIKKMIEDNKCVALKLAANGEAAKQFGQIFPVVNVPISCFITPGGVPLEMLVQYDSFEGFKDKLSKTLEMFKNSAEYQASNVAGASSSGNLQDRVDKAQELIKERQEQKWRESEENARLAEIKRREEGRKMLTAQERLKEAETLKNAQDQKRAKQEDKEHLKKLREQIAADRAEKAAKFGNEKTDQQQVVEQKKQQKVELDERQQQEELEKRKRFALLQFRLPDGSSLRHQFVGTAVFSEAQQWVSQEINSPISSFQLIQMVPRREYTQDDQGRSFVELDLTPSGTLMVLPNSTVGRAGQQAENAGTIGWLWGLVTAPIRYVFNAMYLLIFGTGPAPPPVTSSTTNNESNNQQPSTSGGAGSSSGNNPRTTNTNQQPTGSGSPIKVYQFRNTQDLEPKKDDDNATWNGNSTQQL